MERWGESFIKKIGVLVGFVVLKNILFFFSWSFIVFSIRMEVFCFLRDVI